MKYTFSEFANLGNLSQYNLSDLKKLIKKMEISEYTCNGEFFACFRDRYTILIIEFFENGNFKKIKFEKIELPDNLSE